MLPKAYTTKEKQAIKTFTDTAYGYYDHSETPSILHQATGILFGQFLRYYPAKVKYYLSPTKKDSTRGYNGQKYQVEDDGTKTMLWKKDVIESDGTITIEEVPE